MMQKLCKNMRKSSEICNKGEVRWTFTLFGVTVFYLPGTSFARPSYPPKRASFLGQIAYKEGMGGIRLILCASLFRAYREQG